LLLKIACSLLKIACLLTMLEYHHLSQNRTFAADVLIPFAREILRFYRLHYQRWPQGSGKLVISPAQTLETWQEVINPSEQIAGVRAVLGGLARLPAAMSTAEDKALWSELNALMPDVPTLQDAVTNATYLSHAEYWYMQGSLLCIPQVHPCC